MSNEPLTVELNEERPHDLSVETSFSTTDTFAVVLKNHGQPVHVHLNLDDALSQVATLSTGNHYIEGDEEKAVEIFVTPVQEPVSGTLKIVSGYGSETATVNVEITPGPGSKPGVDIDDTLTQPGGVEPQPTGSERALAAVSAIDTGVLPLVLLAIVALALAAGVASAFDSLAISLGAGVVVLGVLTGLALAIR
ncbi:hypothetical protein ACFQJC_10160 [Haloferax namakaokahaiae]|uniref:Uncharacterized protein n=1 Tax=Haloferax namakaokahaiae TaxID=1748331 RepID=A0ABD5ZF96_9EURY